MSRPRLLALLLAFITLLVFLPTGQFSFVNYDDNDYITQNPMVKNGLTLAGVRWAFTTFHAGNWHPLTWLSHMADLSISKIVNDFIFLITSHEIKSLDAKVCHITNVLFHAVNSALLFALLLRLTKRLWPCAFIAALFAWHPLHVESVAWVSERKDVLSTFFALLALLSYAKYVELSKAQSSRAKVFFIWSLVAFAFGLMAKPMLVTLPCLLLLLDFWPLKRFPLSAFRFPLLLEKIPFFALTAASCVVTFVAQKSGEAVVSLTTVSLGYRLENTPVAMVNYLLKLFYPADLCAVYPMLESISALQVTLAVAVLVLITLAAWRGRNSCPYLLLGWLWFLGTLVPVIGLVQVGGTAMADRYTYIPSIGFFIAVVFLLADFAARIQAPKIIAAGVAGVMLTGCILATEKQLPFWRDGETLFRQALAVTRNNDVAWGNLGLALEQQQRLDEARAAYAEALKISPSRYQLHNNLGSVLDKLGRSADALTQYKEAVRLNPNLSQLRINFANALLKQGCDAEAVAELTAALKIEPDNFQILTFAALVLAADQNAEARDGQIALKLAQKAHKISGGNQPMVHDILGMALAETGDFTNAQICAENALTLATAAQMKGLEPLHQRLELYKNRQPWRESFRATNAPAKSGGTSSTSP